MTIGDSKGTLEWGTVLDIHSMDPDFHQRNTEAPALVTVGLPTYKRPEMLRRALASLAAQSFRDFVVVVSDNAGNDENTLAAVKEYADRLPEVYLFQQSENLGSMANFQFVLACAETRYFMWLSDDDEISANYLEVLVPLLEADSAAVGAMGEWIMVDSNGKGHKQRQGKNSSENRSLRLARYILGPSDDSFFYGVHRLDNLRRCHFDDFFFPNAGVLTNFCYVFLFDLLLQGPVKYSDRAQWICHAQNTTKNYTAANSRGVKAKLWTLTRRMNIHYLYSKKTALVTPSSLAFTIPASVAGLTRENLRFLFSRLRPEEERKPPR